MRQFWNSFVLVLLVAAIGRPAPVAAQASGVTTQDRLVVFEAFMRST